jgi:hypothetical protein
MQLLERQPRTNGDEQLVPHVMGSGDPEADPMQPREGAFQCTYPGLVAVPALGNPQQEDHFGAVRNSGSSP